MATADALRGLDIGLFGEDFLLTSEKSDDDLRAVLEVAEFFKSRYRQNRSGRLFETGLAISQFRDQSTRTRFAFASASALLGLSHVDFDEGKSQVAHGETVRETATMISFLCDVIGIRDDLFIGRGHTYMKEVGAALDAGVRESVLDARPAIINLQCDIDHPTQSMADLLHLKHVFGGDLDQLRGKKIAMTWAYSPSYGKPLSVPQGIITLMTRFGMDVHLAHPEGYELLPDTLDVARRHAEESGGRFQISHSMEEAFEDADIVYPKSWAPFSVMERRTASFEQGDDDGLRVLEQEGLANNARHIGWECDAEMMKLTKNGEALYMHCLPADISGVSCEAGEVSAEVFEKYRIATYQEARYKPYIIAAMITLAKFRDPAAVVERLVERDDYRS